MLATNHISLPLESSNDRNIRILVGGSFVDAVCNTIAFRISSLSPLHGVESSATMCDTIIAT